jgi:hypothetical protein
VRLRAIRSYLQLLWFLVVIPVPAAFSSDADGVFGNPMELSPEILDALRAPDKMTIYSLDPSDYGKEAASQKVFKTRYFDYAVLGSTILEDDKVRKQIGAALIEETGFGSATFCGFVPHHGVRVHSGRLTMDYVICFDCRDIHLHRNGKIWARPMIHTKISRIDDSHFKFAPSKVEALLNASLTQAKVPLAEEYLKSPKRKI